MKRGLNFFNKKGKKPRRREDRVDYDEDYGRQDYEEEYDDYDEDDYADDEFDEEYGDDEEYYEDEAGDEAETGYFGNEPGQRPETDEYEAALDKETDVEDKIATAGTAAGGRIVNLADYREIEDIADESEPEEAMEGEDDYAEDERDYAEGERDYAGDDRDYAEDDRDYAEDEEYDEDYDREYDSDEDYRNEDDGYDGEYEEDYRGEEYDGEYEEDYRDEDYDEEYDDYGDEEYDEVYDDYADDEDGYVPRGRRAGKAGLAGLGIIAALTGGNKDKAGTGRGRHEKSGRGRDNRGNNHRKDEPSTGARIIAFVKETSFAERAAAIVAILLVVGAIFTMSFYSKALKKTAELGSFAEVGANLEISDVVGSGGLIAVADAERARAMTAQIMEEEREEEEAQAEEAKNITVKMTLTTIKSDMKIKFINSETSKLVADVPFNVDVVTPDGTKISYDDHDRDGIIYKKDLTKGTYKITPVALPSEYSNIKLDTSTKSLDIKDTVAMKAVDVSNEIKKESQINVAKEEAVNEQVVESELQDTVEWVDSNQGSVGSGESDGTYQYEEVDRSNVVDIITGSLLPSGSVRRTSLTRAKEQPDTTELDENSDNSNDESSEGGSNSEESQEPQQEELKDIKLDYSSVTLYENSSDNITVSGPSDYSLSVTENDSVKLSKSGAVITITGKAAGTTDVTVSASGYRDASFTVTVNGKEPDPVPETKQIKLDKTSITIKAGASETVTASESASYTFEQSGKGSVEISTSGKSITVTGKSAGSVKVTVSASGYESASFDVTVEADDPDKKDIKLDPSSTSLSLAVGGKATIKAGGPKSVECTSDNDKIAKAKVSGNSIEVTGVAAGKAALTIKADGYNTVTVNVTVAESTGEIKMKIAKLTLVQGKSYKLEQSSNIQNLEFSSGKTSVATVEKDGTVKAVAAGETTITVKSAGCKDATVAVTVIAKSTTLKDKSGNVLYVKDGDGKFKEATYENYYNGDKLYIRKGQSDGVRHGWWTIDGKTYYYDKNGNAVTGEQVINHVKYNFDSNGVRQSSSNGGVGIDVSKHNGNIDWKAVKNSGVDFAIIRCGYRGYSTGVMVEDPLFKQNIKGATAAGLRVGVYYYSQAVNEVEAVEEASAVLSFIKGYGLALPVYMDVEASGGRADGISVSQRTANIKAFCGTIQNGGYKAGLYANKTWLTSYINTAQLTGYKIWLAQYATTPSYTATRYDMWQYTSKGKVSGISGKVDMNILYN